MAKASVARQPNAVVRYFRETMGEMRKVNWPSRAEATNLTIMVLIVCTVMALGLGLADALFTRLFAFILSI